MDKRILVVVELSISLFVEASANISTIGSVFSNIKLEHDNVCKFLPLSLESDNSCNEFLSLLLSLLLSLNSLLLESYKKSRSLYKLPSYCLFSLNVLLSEEVDFK